MYRLRVSKSYGDEAPMIMIGCYAFERKGNAIATAIKGVPKKSEIEWVKGNNGDVKYNFRVGTMTYQFWIDTFPTVDHSELLKDTTITQEPQWCEKRGFHFL